LAAEAWGKMLLEKIINSKIIPEDNLFVANRTLEKIQVLKEKHKKYAYLQNKQRSSRKFRYYLHLREDRQIHKTVLLEIRDVLDNSKHIISLNGSILFGTNRNSIVKIIKYRR